MLLRLGCSPPLHIPVGGGPRKPRPIAAQAAATGWSPLTHTFVSLVSVSLASVTDVSLSRSSPAGQTELINVTIVSFCVAVIDEKEWAPGDRPRGLLSSMLTSPCQEFRRGGLARQGEGRECCGPLGAGIMVRGREVDTTGGQSSERSASCPGELHHQR